MYFRPFFAFHRKFKKRSATRGHLADFVVKNSVIFSWSSFSCWPRFGMKRIVGRGCFSCDFLCVVSPFRGWVVFMFSLWVTNDGNLRQPHPLPEIRSAIKGLITTSLPQLGGNYFKKEWATFSWHVCDGVFSTSSGLTKAKVILDISGRLKIVVFIPRFVV